MKKLVAVLFAGLLAGCTTLAPVITPVAGGAAVGVKTTDEAGTLAEMGQHLRNNWGKYLTAAVVSGAGYLVYDNNDGFHSKGNNSGSQTQTLSLQDESVSITITGSGNSVEVNYQSRNDGE